MDKKTVLLIEDNELNMKLFRSLLSMDNYIVLETNNAETGIELTKKHHPDIILMDIQLPGMDGLTATTIIKKDVELFNIPIIALTSFAMEGDEEKALAAGCSGYITKPIDTRKFLDTVAGYMSLTRDQAKSGSKKILIVDDDQLNVKLLMSMITGNNYSILKAYDGEEALTTVRDEHPDLILLDIMMPKIDGYKVLEILKADPATKNIPVILVTALNNPEDKIRGMEAGADEFLNKPVNKTELNARVKSLLRLKEYQEQLATHGKTEKSFLKQYTDNGPVESQSYRPCILVVEDNDKDLTLIENIFINKPFNLRIARDGKEALDIINQDNIDLILLDILLPNINGFEVCSRVKEIETTKNIQILIITCLDDLQSKIKGIDSGADDYLVKPINKEELEVRVRALIKKKEYLDKLSSKYETALSAAITDKLTGLYNHTYFKHYLKLEMKRTERQGQQLALIMLDVDNFKRYNDTHGHMAGDVVLQELARLIKKSIRDIDFAARYGGEEFAIIIPNAQRACASNIAERIRSTIREYKFSNSLFEDNAPLTVSQGIALFPQDAMSMEDFIQKADMELYKAKRQGKDCVCIYSQGPNTVCPSGTPHVPSD